MAARAIIKQETSKAIEYMSGNETVKLSPTIIKNYLTNGNGNITDQEAIMFLNLCRFQHLNPFLREAYLIKYGSSPATMVVGKDVFTKRAQNNEKYRGKQAGIIVINESGEVIEREGTFYLPNETIVGGWAKVFIEGHDTPEYGAVSFDEYAGRTKEGKLNSQWATKPATMIRKVALVQTLREAFPADFQGLYSAEEIPAGNDFIDVTAPIATPPEAVVAKKAITAEESPEVSEQVTVAESETVEEGEKNE